MASFEEGYFAKYNNRPWQIGILIKKTQLKQPSDNLCQYVMIF